MAGYSALDRVQHRLALQFRPLAELSFDLDQGSAKPDTKAVAQGRHVFVSGLARAGTTILMRRFYATGQFRSLTYRDMPFVLAPNLWRKLRGSKASGEATERAHGDRIKVNIDSPESLDEVFWRIFDGGSYIRDDHLVPHQPDAEVMEKFIRYVGAVLTSDPEGRTRYLSKNNNNILRLPALARAFPQALILIPFRDPLTHAASLLRQHQRFVTAQADEPFVRSYMTWLGHHEFGGDHRPFRFPGPAGEQATDPGALDYWLALWCRTYGWLAETAPEGAVFVCYEDLCENPDVWAHLAEWAGVEAGTAQEAFDLSKKAGGMEADDNLVTRSRAIYDKMKAKSSRS